MSQRSGRDHHSPTETGLRDGGQGSGVTALQQYLRRFGYLQAEADPGAYARIRASSFKVEARDGIFDEATATAVRAYQTFHGLPATGELDDATVIQMALPRCGFPDLWDVSDLQLPEGVSRFVLQGNRWYTDTLQYGFQNFTPDLTRDEVRDGVQIGFGLWEAVTPLSFEEVPLGESPEIQILFAAGDHGDGAGNAFDGVGGTLAHAFYPPPNGGAIAGDAHFDEAETWSMRAPVLPDRFDFATIAAHECGHSLGLDHSTVSGALMRPTFAAGTGQRFLHQDDIDGIQAIYLSGVAVPLVQELRPAQAAARLRSVGLVPKFAGVSGGSSWVWRQSPRAGRRVAEGSAVQLQLRSGPIP